jgi:acylphosphatase
VIFHGRVQGVWFRASTRDIAIQEEVRGWVRNLPDGAVEAVFEGSDEAVAKVLTRCRNMPSPARVDSMDVERSPSKGEFSGFKVRY